MKTSSKNTTSRHKHHSYFDRQPDAWNIETFIKAIYPAIIGGQRPPPEPSACPDWMQRLQRTIFRSWANNLGNISSCQHCHHPRRKRADVLLSDFNKQNSRLSDRSSAKSILQELIDKHPPVYVTFGPTIVNSIVNNGNGNVNSQSFGNGVADQSPNEPSSGDDSADVATSRSKSKSQRDAEFRQAYYSFLDDCKWVLPSGDTVEDTFFKAYFAKSTPPQVRNAIGNWTLLVGDSDMQDLFHPDDWPAILARVKPLPSLDLEIAEELVQRFGSVTSTAQRL